MVASFLKISSSKIKDYDHQQLLWEITKKNTKGVAKAALIQLAGQFNIELSSDSVTTVRLCIEQDLARRSLALVPESLPSTKEIAESRLKKTSSSKRVSHDNADVIEDKRTTLPEVKNLTHEEAKKLASLIGFKTTDSTNRPDCISFISKKGIQNLDVRELQLLCEKAGLVNDMYETTKSELRYALLEDAARKGIAILPSVDWQALEKEYEFSIEQKRQLEEEKAVLAAEKVRLKALAKQEKEREREEAKLLKQQQAQELRNEKAFEREQARLAKQRQAEAKKTAKAMGKLVGGVFGGIGSGIGAMFKESKSEKARKKWLKSFNTYNNK